MNYKKSELIKQSLKKAIEFGSEHIEFSRNAVKDLYVYICCLQHEIEYDNRLLEKKQAEIERLKKTESFECNVTKLFDRYKNHIKSETIKEFIELLKENANNWNELTVEQIERLAKIKINGG